jgi:hypothetical protein
MPSTLKVDQIEGQSGSTLTIPAGQTLDISSATVTLPTPVVTLTGSQTLTNKTLTAPVITTPVISSISNTGTLTLPSSTDTIVGRATTDTLTNKTLTSPIIGTSILDTNGNELALLTATASAVNEVTIANSATGSSPNLSSTGSDTNIDLRLTPKGTGFVTFNGGGKIQHLAEKVTVAATAATGTIAYDLLTQSVLYFTTNASANWTLNVRGDASTTLDSILEIGEAVTVSHLVTMTTAYYNSTFQIDGTTSGITIEWQGGTAPTSGNANSVDVYTYTIIKTADAIGSTVTQYTVLASQVQFA